MFLWSMLPSEQLTRDQKALFLLARSYDALNRPHTINLCDKVGQLADYWGSPRYSCLVWAVLFNWILLYTTLPTASDAVVSDSKN